MNGALPPSKKDKASLKYENLAIKPKFILKRQSHHSNRLVIYRNDCNIPIISRITPKYIIQFKYTVTTPKYITI